MTRPVRWYCDGPNGCGQLNVNTRACTNSECTAEPISDLRWRRAAWASRLAFLGAAEPVPEGSKRRWVALSLVFFVAAVCALIALPVAGLLDAVGGSEARSLDPGCRSRPRSCEPVVTDGMFLRVRSDGLLGGLGEWATSDRVIVQLRGVDSGESIRFALSGAHGLHVIGRLERDAARDVWVVRWRDQRTKAVERYAGFGPRSRLGLTLPHAMRFDSWAVGDIRGRPIRDVTAPLSQLPTPAQVLGVALVSFVAFRRATRRSTVRMVQLLAATLVAIAMLHWIGPTVPRTLGKTYAQGGYTPTFGSLLLALSLLVFPLAALAAFAGTARFGRGVVELADRGVLPDIVRRLLHAALVGAICILVLQLVDQLLGGLLLGWSP